MSAEATGLRGNAVFAVVILTAMNLLNYIDRWVPSAVKPLFQKDLNLSDEQTALPLTAFIVVYMLTSPLFGTLAETRSRPLLIAAGVAIWSLATASAALATGFYTFLLARALVGVGEAAYATIAPALIADHYEPSRRNKILTLFYVATPVGAALGFTLGGYIGAQPEWGWRGAFVLCGLPGLVVAAIALLLKDPPRGRFDAPHERQAPPPWSQALASLRHNPRYLFTVAGYVGVSFAIGGIGDWFPTLLFRDRGFALEEAGAIAGQATVVGGLLGTVLGGVIAEALIKRGVKEAYLWTSALSLIPAVVLAVVAIYFAETRSAVFASILLCQVFLWMYNGPVNALLVNSVGPSLRTRAFALSIFAIHAFGDALSPPIIGKVSSLTSNLPLAMCLVLLALIAALIIWTIGAWRLNSGAPAAET